MDRKSTKAQGSNQIDELIEQYAQQALAYAHAEFDKGHPVWESIHHQLECFCDTAEECSHEHDKAHGRHTH